MLQSFVFDAGSLSLLVFTADEHFYCRINFARIKCACSTFELLQIFLTHGNVYTSGLQPFL